MMDELELLKKDWKKREQEFPKLSHDDIYKMMLKKSSSYVKWIFYISIIELGLGILVAIFYHPSYEKEFPLPRFMDFIYLITIPIIIYFIYRFFKNYQQISTTASVKELMKSILKARRTVKLYILINICLGGIISIISLTATFIQLNEDWEQLSSSEKLKEYFTFILIAIVATALILGVFLAIYYLLYGILLKRLKRNYKHLKKMEGDE
ncbi:hypothetical protein OOZ15_16085 [Galbibacter sp. EGI 63066]|uniref:hypothetical protein n=1 Tax=Galbibacter sp. EGI 63066 TaxID=2993559 RepID=UPI002249918A|nr:hypothetical protein [Galbibacter sp. EGI 63066]MCX2681475.1 hypothetical protein [Galbibacter sp. EGI 63066]